MIHYEEEDEDDLSIRVGHKARRRFRMWERYENEPEEEEEHGYLWLENSERPERNFSSNGHGSDENQNEEDLWNFDFLHDVDSGQFENKTDEMNLLLLVALTLLIRVSKKELGMVLVLIEHFVGRTINITVEDVFKEIEKKRMNHAPTTRMMCAKCFSNASKKKPCSNENCENYGIRTKRSKPTDPIVVTTFAIEGQIKDMLIRNIEDVVTFHRRIHYAHVGNDGKEFRQSQRYRELMESRAEFEDKVINIALSLFFDGFRLKKQTRKEYTPFYLRIESFDSKKKVLPSSSVLFAMLIYRHLADDLLLNNKDAVDTADFEKLHKFIQCGIVDHNCAHQSIEMSRRFLCLRDTLAHLHNSFPSCTVTERLFDLKSGSSIRFPSATSVTETMKVSAKWKLDYLDIASLNPLYGGFIKQESIIYYRALIRNQPLQSKHWASKKTERSQMHIISFKKRRNCRGFGEVCLFVEQNGSSYILIEEFSTSSSTRLDITKIPRNLLSLAQQIRSASDSSDSLIVKVMNQSGLILVSTNDIISPALSFDYNGHSFFCPIRFSPIVN
ncbi:hypothetical protein B9Z55_000164 [Caenorhabditis nigoni]|uniref:Uncharacterized protein n=1 Tax=Caenorhabditis nigoni TaxID=1611254 RepID=A0A2G5VGN4_9PELO|nr:hypothetical protein B9Z55_000164 [Caenorhabditis nigoni]